MCLGIGALLGLIILYKNLNKIKKSINIQLLILGALFSWILIKDFYYYQDYFLQIFELKSIWKRIFLSIIFGFGLGYIIMKENNNIFY
jgi:uncharacterized membrane protein (Fun14 family)